MIMKRFTSIIHQLSSLTRKPHLFCLISFFFTASPHHAGQRSRCKSNPAPSRKHMAHKELDGSWWAPSRGDGKHSNFQHCFFFQLFLWSLDRHLRDQDLIEPYISTQDATYILSGFIAWFKTFAREIRKIPPLWLSPPLVKRLFFSHNMAWFTLKSRV